MKKILLITVLFVVVSCGSNKTEIKKEIDTQYSEVISISENDPCKIFLGYQKLDNMETLYNTTYYSEITTEKFHEYRRLCDEKNKEMEEMKRSIVERTTVGNWIKGFYIDEFGDKTNQRFISLTTKGKFSNTATEGSPLRISMYLDNGDLEKEDPWFRFYEYDGKNPEKGVIDIYTMSCKIKDKNGSVFRLLMSQNKGEDYFYIDGKTSRLFVDKFKKMIKEGETAKFACKNERYTNSDRYVFSFSFKYFDNILGYFKQESNIN